MDPITAAVVAAVANLGQSAVKDAYDALKSLLARKFGADSGVSRAVGELEAKPESAARRAVLQEEVAGVGADADAEVAAAAGAVLERAGAERPSVRVHASGERSVAIGGSLQGGMIVTGDQPLPPRPAAHADE